MLTWYFIGKPKPEKTNFSNRIFICKLLFFLIYKACTKACEKKAFLDYTHFG